MSTGVVAAGAAAVALYVYLKQKALQDGTSMEPVLPVEASRNAPDHAPSNWSEALYHVKEVLKYMINETLGRWHTIDLFVGLAYLSHREALEYPAADIAAKGFPVGQGLNVPDQLKLMLELQEARRYMLYCKGLKLRREDMQARFWKEHLGAETLTIVKQQATAGVLRPAYVLVSDRTLRCVVLCIRGTHSMKDLFTSLAGAAKPHHVVDPDSGRLVLGYSHLGMLAAARWLARQVTSLLMAALEDNPGYQLRIVGHSMGGGTAALLTMMLRGGLNPPPHPSSPSPATAPAHGGIPTSPSAPAGLNIAAPTSPSQPATSTSPSPRPQHEPHTLASPPSAAAQSSSAAAAAAAGSAATPATDPFREARCVAIACPSVVTLELAVCCRDYVTSIVNGTDIVPTFCAASVDRLREDVTRSSWFSEFSRDMRSGVVRALQGGVRGVGTATQWTSRNILQPAVVPFRACYATTTTRRTKRRTGTTTAAAAAAACLLSAPSSPSRPLTPVEEQEQFLLAAGAGGGAAAAAAAAAAVAALNDVAAAGSAVPPSSSAAVLAALNASERGFDQSAPPAQAMSPAGLRGAAGGGGGLDERAMAEAVQSCMYAVGSAVSAHQQHQPGNSAPNPAITEALELLGSLPQELGPPVPQAHYYRGHSRHHSRDYAQALNAADGGALREAPAAAAAADGDDDGAAGAVAGAGSRMEVERTAGSLLTGGGAAVLGAGGVSTALAYGSSLRRRLWPWGQGQAQDGFGDSGGAGSGGSGSMSPMAGTGAPLGVSDVGPSGAAYGTAGGAMGEEGAGAAGGAAGSFGASTAAPAHGSAPDSPGKAKAAAASAGSGGGLSGAGGGASGVSGGGLVAGVALSSTRAIGDWLWRGGGMLFTTCTTPRRPISASQPGAGPNLFLAHDGAPGGAIGRSATTGGAGVAVSGSSGGGGLVARRAARVASLTAAAAARRGPLEMDVGDVYDDESEPDEEDSEGGAGAGPLSAEGSHEDDETEDEEEEEEEEEEGGVGRGGARPGRSTSGRGSVSGGGGGVGMLGGGDSEQQLQAGITAVVAAVTNQASREAAEGPQAMLHDENTRAAEDVLREVRAADAADAAKVRRRRTGARGRPGRRSGDAGGGGSGRNALSPPGRASTMTITEEPEADLGLGLGVGARGTVSDAEALAAAGRSRRNRRVGATASEADPNTGPEEQDEEDGEGEGEGKGLAAPMLGASPGGRAASSGAGGAAPAGPRPGLSSAEYEARLYKRRLYPAGRILHLFPGAAVTGQPLPQPVGNAAAAGDGTDAAAAATNPLDAAAARSSASQAPYMLYEVADPQAYSRVRLCRTMVSDHLIPAYLAALDSVLSQLEEQQQRTAREAWERELQREREQEQARQQQQL